MGKEPPRISVPIVTANPIAPNGPQHQHKCRNPECGKLFNCFRKPCPVDFYAAGGEEHTDVPEWAVGFCSDCIHVAIAKRVGK